MKLQRACGMAAAMGGLLLVWACRDVAGPTGARPETPPAGAPAAPLHLIAVDCIGNVADRTITCEAPRASTAEANENLIVGGQNVYVTLASRFPNYDGTAFTFDVNVRNLIPQALGTTNGLTLDPSGVRVFFHTGPTVTSGSGSITVVGDGTDTFTGSNQPFYQYNQILPQFALSAWKTWRLEMPPTVSTFAFLLYVAAAVQYPDGWVDVLGHPDVRSGSDRQLTGVVRTAVGRIDSSTTVSWTSADPHYATVDAGGLVHGYRAGLVDVIANTVSGPARSGRLTMNVLPVTRVWTAAEDGNWSNGNNWLPDSIIPQPTDTASIPADMAVYPGLTQNASVGTIVMDGNATIQLGAFNLVAHGSVTMPQFTSAAISSSSGLLSLDGNARTVNGRVSRIRVNGTYSLSGNLTVERRIEVQLGRLTSSSFRIQQNP